MNSSDLVAHFSVIQNAIHQVGPVVLPIPAQDLVMRRFCCFIESLFDLKTSWQRYDADHRQHSAYHEELTRVFGSDGPITATPEKEEQARQYVAMLPKLRFDIRCIYVFAKIACITFAGLLFVMAGESSQKWKQMGRFMKRIKEPDAPDLLKQFNERFLGQLEWFDAQVNLYRNDFIEHTVATPLTSGLVTSETGVHVTGLTGTGLSEKDTKFIEELQAELGDRFPEFATKTGFDRYDWICQNLEKIPENRTAAAEDMIRRVGLESGDLTHLAEKMSAMFGGFVLFFGEWRHKRRSFNG